MCSNPVFILPSEKVECMIYSRLRVTMIGPLLVLLFHFLNVLQICFYLEIFQDGKLQNLNLGKLQKLFLKDFHFRFTFETQNCKKVAA